MISKRVSGRGGFSTVILLDTAISSATNTVPQLFAVVLLDSEAFRSLTLAWAAISAAQAVVRQSAGEVALRSGRNRGLSRIVGMLAMIAPPTAAALFGSLWLTAVLAFGALALFEMRRYEMLAINPRQALLADAAWGGAVVFGLGLVSRSQLDLSPILILLIWTTPAAVITLICRTRASPAESGAHGRLHILAGDAVVAVAAGYLHLLILSQAWSADSFRNYRVAILLAGPLVLLGPSLAIMFLRDHNRNPSSTNNMVRVALIGALAWLVLVSTITRLVTGQNGDTGSALTTITIAVFGWHLFYIATAIPAARLRHESRRSMVQLRIVATTLQFASLLPLLFRPSLWPMFHIAGAAITYLVAKWFTATIRPDQPTPAPDSRIARYIPSLQPEYGGPLFSAVAMDRARDLPVRYITSDQSEEIIALPARSEVSVVPAYRIRCARSRKFINSLEGIDHLIIHGTIERSSLALARAAQALGIPVTTYLHGMLDNHFPSRSIAYRVKYWIWWKLHIRPLLVRSNRIIITSELERQTLLRKVTRFAGKFARVAYGTQLVEADIRDPLPTNEFVFIGRIDPKKNLEHLVDVASALREETPIPFRVRIYGPAEATYLKTLESRCAAQGLEEIMTFHSPIYGDDKHDLLASATAFLLPSYQENYAVSVSEALAVGCPAIVSDRVGLSHAIADFGAGVVLRLDVTEWTDTLKRILEMDRRAMRSLRTSSLACAHEHCSISRALLDFEIQVISHA